MLAKLARKLPPGEDEWLFEPKWDGFRCIVFRDGDRIELYSRNRKPLGRYFPELSTPLQRALPERCIVDGEIVVPDLGDRGLDFDALLQRIHPAESRINRLAAETPAEFVAFDLLAKGDRELVDQAMLTRRALLVDSIEQNERVRLTPSSTDRMQAEEWFDAFEGAGLDGVIAKPVAGTYEQGKRALIKVKHVRTADCAVPGYRIHKDGNGVGSLMLGLFDDDGALRHVGVAASFTAARRSELLEELKPLTENALDDHPWATWSEAGAQQQHRWNANKDMGWLPIRPEWVAEVKYGSTLNGRFREVTKMLRWRHDKEPSQCDYDQLDEPVPIGLDKVLKPERSGETS